jgi:3-methylcrotonyl-CoA carboxylase alpha subunit
VEFIVDGSGPLRTDGFWFMEMNTRLQVEHPVTEAVTGLDLVALQIAVAEGKPLPVAQEDLSLSGHAIEARLYAEDAPAGFLPATGPLAQLRFGDGLRIDTGVRQGDAVSPHYDPMIAKLIAHGPDRASALRALARGLEHSAVAGCVTNRAFLARLLRDADVVSGDVDTGLIARRGAALAQDAPVEALDHALAAVAWLGGRAGFRHFGPARAALALAGDPVETLAITARDGAWEVTGPLGAVTLEDVQVGAERITARHAGVRVCAGLAMSGAALTLHRPGASHVFTRHDPAAEALGAGADMVLAPMPGRIVSVLAEAGAEVAQGDGLMVLEAMKMEHRLVAPRAGRVAGLLAAEGDQVAQGALLVQFETD